jgi:hypothetical protein
MRSALVASVLPVVCLLATLPLIAGDGAIPIWEATTITEKGSYVLTRDIEEGLLSITANDVDLDLNGFRLNGNEPALLATSVRGLTVHDGSVGPYNEDGIHLVDVEDVHLYRLRAYSADDFAIEIRNGSNVIVEDCFIVWHSLYATGSNISFRNNQIKGMYGFAIGSHDGECTGCSLIGNSFFDAFVEVRGTGNTLASNRFVGTGVVIYGDGNVIENNFFSGYPYYFGLTLFGSDNVYRGNIARGNNGEPGECSNPSATTDFCDEGTNNTSHGDNYLPDLR